MLIVNALDIGEWRLKDMNHKPTRPTVGPRGGRAVMATPCAECVSWRSCRPAPITEPWGCESWVDQDGRRALPDLLEPEPVSPCQACQGMPSECRPCGCPEVEVERVLDKISEPFLENPDPEPEPFRPAAPFVPDQSRGEGPAQAVLPMPEAGPLFAGCLEARK